MRERGLLVRSRRLRARRRKEWGREEASEPNQIWQSDMTKIWAGPAVGGLSGERDRLLHAGDRGLASLASLPDRRRTGSGGAGGARTAARGQPRSSLDVNHRQWNAVHFFTVLGDVGAARHHTPVNGLSSPGRQQLHRTVPPQLKEEEVWTAEYRTLEEARASIVRWIEEYNHTGLIAESEIALPARPS